MFVFQEASFAAATKLGANLAKLTGTPAFAKILAEAKDISLPKYMERSFSRFAKKLGISRDQLLSLSLQSMDLTNDGLGKLKKVKWTHEDKKILKRQTKEISRSDLAGDLHDSAAKNLPAQGASVSSKAIENFVATHIDVLAGSFLMKMKASQIPGETLRAKDIDHAAFNIVGDHASFTLCFAKASCYPIDLLKLKNDPDKVSKVSSLMENGKIDKAHVTEVLGKNAWENLQTISKVIYDKFVDYFVKSAMASNDFIGIIGQDALNRQSIDSNKALNEQAYAQSNEFLKDWNDKRST